MAISIYRTTSTFPKEELYSLTSQIRRAAVSIPSNIAEGCGKGDSELGRFLQISLGSAHELEYQIILSQELNFIKTPDFEKLNNDINEVKGMLIALIKKVK